MPPTSVISSVFCRAYIYHILGYYRSKAATARRPPYGIRSLAAPFLLWEVEVEVEFLEAVALVDELVPVEEVLLAAVVLADVPLVEFEVLGKL